MRPRRRECAEEAHRPPAESEVPGAPINRPINQPKIEPVALIKAIGFFKSINSLINRHRNTRQA